MAYGSQSIRLAFVAALAVAICGGAPGFTALQFDATVPGSVARTGDGAVAAWASTGGGVAATPCHTNGTGWAAPQHGAGAIDFAAEGRAVSPLSFPLSETGLVARAFIVAAGTDAATCRTLLDAPCPLRLMPAEEGGAVHFATSSVLSSAALAIDFAPSTAFSPGLHVYEMELSEPCPLRDLYVGGSPATPAWGRGWNGSVREAVFVSPSATAEEVAVVRSYLSKRWRIGRCRSGVAGELSVLKRLGIRQGGVYGSMMLLR